jgi:hypothetical protein
MALALACLGFSWFSDELSSRTKVVFTLLYAASWAFWLVPDYGSICFAVTQCVLAMVFGVATFGLDWLIAQR